MSQTFIYPPPLVNLEQSRIGSGPVVWCNVNIGTVPGVEKFAGQLPAEPTSNNARNYVIK